ncbi:zinc finger MYM-type protein 1-like [Centruroides sculpturatus]|uniref:zinc finger MYM-type protein 1-like n=1 Tax=Centruroides sculpturatus TaxID=218467 RepID=UPI000C6E8525|nr:zinc finger MYM-type protein 1-like [Centruroides sculpturatus]
MNKSLQKEVEHWDKVLRRLIALTMIMAQQNIPFRGSSDKVYEENNGNFLKILEFLAEFDLVMEKHLMRAKKKPNSVHYLGKTIQNEILELIGQSIKSKILNKVQDSNYYALIVDCTTDTSHQEQMSVIVRYVDVNPNNNIQINQSFLGFHLVEGSTGIDARHH